MIVKWDVRSSRVTCGKKQTAKLECGCESCKTDGWRKKRKWDGKGFI